MGISSAKLTTAPTITAVINTPGTASRKIGNHCLRRVRRLRRRAASKTRGGTSRARINWLVISSLAPLPWGRAMTP